MFFSIKYVPFLQIKHVFPLKKKFFLSKNMIFIEKDIDWLLTKRANEMGK